MKSSIVEIQVTDTTGKIHSLKCNTEDQLTLKDICKINNVPIDSVCDGMMLCGTCHCYILNSIEVLPVMSVMEEALLSDIYTSDSSSRLACQIPITSDLNGMKIKIATI